MDVGVLVVGVAINVLMANRAEVRPEVVSQAQSEAAEVFRAAGVTLAWVNDGAAAVAEGRHIDLTVAIVSRQHAALLARQAGLEKEDVLGFAPVNGSADHGRMAYVFAGRLDDFAGRHHLPLAHVLGQVIAHELGHLMLGVNSHGQTGIMRAHPETRSAMASAFSPSEARTIREYLTALSLR